MTPTATIMQLMSHLLFFYIKIVLIKLVRLHDNRHAVGNRDAVAAQANALRRIIRNQANAGKAKVGQNLRA